MSGLEERLACRRAPLIAIEDTAISHGRFRNFGDYYAGGYTPFPNRLLGMLTPTQASTYLHLRRFGNMREGARPSVNTVTACVGRKRRTVEDAIRALENVHREIKRDSRGQNRPCLYHFASVLDDEGLEPFTKVPNWVLLGGLPPAVLMVYVTILEVKDVEKTLRLEDIARKCRTSKGTVSGAIEELKRRQLIEVDRPKFKAQRNRYGTLPRSLADLRSTDTVDSKFLSDVGSTEIVHRSTETVDRSTEIVDRSTETVQEKDSFEKDSREKDSTGKKTRPTAPGSAGARRSTDGHQLQQDRQRHEGIRERLQRMGAEGTSPG
ncbi:hypothetical protein LV457_16855 [Mycobacterium sp. MYCO198283]|uniref:hypothetical protein n=1 Tax=Mycobacterium sp. MYCO198283 TaxID=2883505 RepID=UPI001E440A6F|nr:hypothetical protein [Mycobacterium sp. MYCO198283]MCG5433946.1 hypothetical protein [Mycobacterium sp. MYCO198283]